MPKPESRTPAAGPPTGARPGPRLVDGVEALAAVLHPDAEQPPHPDMARRLR